MPIYTHLNCPIRYAGVLTDSTYRRVIVPVDEGDNVIVSMTKQVAGYPGLGLAGDVDRLDHLSHGRRIDQPVFPVLPCVVMLH